MSIYHQRYNGTEWVNETVDGGGSGGASNHATLTNLAWLLSKHEGTAYAIPGFDSNGDVNERERQTGVAVTAAGIHAALVSLGLITA